MQRILNTRTNTIHKPRDVHKPRDETNPEATKCGSLTHVPRARTRVVGDNELGAFDGIERCGSCFEDAGGY